MEKLIEELKALIAQLDAAKRSGLSEEVLNDLHSAYPFNKYEYAISHLIAAHALDLKQYLELRGKYLERNRYLHVFEMTAPRTFGETWAQGHLNEIVPELKKPSAALDPGYVGQYDFWLDGIRIEVKASRAVKRQSGELLIIKALSSESKSGFDMNFQQIKPECCDVFVWIAVWRDVIRYWVLSSDEVATNPHYQSKQHRGGQGEGQLWMDEKSIDDFSAFEVKPHDMLAAILAKGWKA